MPSVTLEQINKNISVLNKELEEMKHEIEEIKEYIREDFEISDDVKNQIEESNFYTIMK